MSVELFGADVASQVFGCEIDLAAERVGLFGCGLQVSRERGDAEHASAIGDDVAGVVSFGAGVKDDFARSVGVGKGDGLALGVFVGIAFGGEHDDDGVVVLDLEVDAGEFALGGGEHDFHRIGF